MKKVLLIAAVVAIATSCRKDRTCECTDSYPNGTGGTSTVVYSITKKSTKKGATAWCEDQTKATTTVDGVAVTGGATTMTCKIK